MDGPAISLKLEEVFGKAALGHLNCSFLPLTFWPKH